MHSLEGLDCVGFNALKEEQMKEKVGTVMKSIDVSE